MIQVQVVNPRSDYYGKVGYVALHNWTGDSFWVAVSMDGRMNTIARVSLQAF